MVYLGVYRGMYIYFVFGGGIDYLVFEEGKIVGWFCVI